jgi:uncharacterized protein
MDYANIIASQLKICSQQAAAAIELLDAGNTLPFVARYRKETTGGLDEEQLRQLSDLLSKHRALDQRRDTIIRTIKEQGKLTSELQQRLNKAQTLTALEDLYQPYKPKRRTRASMARDKGLQQLADMILNQILTEKSLEQIVAPFLSEDVPDIEQALSGGRDIVAEQINDHPDVRRVVRLKALEWGTLKTEKQNSAEDPKGVYELYYDFEQRVERLRPHQVLAINRGEVDKVLRVQVVIPERDWRKAIVDVFVINPRSLFARQLMESMEDSVNRLLLPAIERDVRRKLTEKAETHAILVFSKNLRALLSQPPLAEQIIIGIDPGYRTGCKAAIIDATGKVLDTKTIYPHEPQRQWDKSKQIIKTLIEKYGVSLIAIGNGTASRETEKLVAEITRDHYDTHYIMVNEAGASVYSASPLARAELPDMDVSMRGAVSIARRVQDPLAELVKIDPQSIGVGMYQHDVDQKMLTESLDRVIESVVNSVGVDVNTASPALLAHVSGIGPKMSERIVNYRDTEGPFRSRQSLKSVPGMGPKSFEQAAGFLRIPNGDNPLDASAIHPESYAVANKLLKKASLTLSIPVQDRKSALDKLQNSQSFESLAKELDVGELTLVDIFDQLIRPGRDPRQDLPKPILRNDVLKMEDLVTGMRLKGTVRNVVDFGAFVDIGVKQDGLLHRSQIPKGLELQVGYVLEVEILTVEKERGRIALGWPS